MLRAGKTAPGDRLQPSAPLAVLRGLDILSSALYASKQSPEDDRTAHGMAVPRHFPGAAADVQRILTAYRSEQERDRETRQETSQEGGRKEEPCTKKKSQDATKVELETRPGSESSVSAGVNHLQTGCLHPSELRDEIHYS